MLFSPPYFQDCVPRGIAKQETRAQREVVTSKLSNYDRF